MRIPTWDVVGALINYSSLKKAYGSACVALTFAKSQRKTNSSMNLFVYANVANWQLVAGNARKLHN